LEASILEMGGLEIMLFGMEGMAARQALTWMCDYGSKLSVDIG